PAADLTFDFAGAHGGAVTMESGEAVGWFVPVGADPPPSEFLLDTLDWKGDPVVSISGRTLRHVWDLVSANPEQIAVDIETLVRGRETAEPQSGVYHWGKHALHVDPSAVIEPGAALDTSHAPIWIDR